MNKFKKGDKVLILDTPNVRFWGKYTKHKSGVGKRAVITGVSSDSAYILDDNKYHTNYKEDDLQLVRKIIRSPVSKSSLKTRVDKLLKVIRT